MPSLRIQPGRNMRPPTGKPPPQIMVPPTVSTLLRTVNMAGPTKPAQ